MNEQASRVPGQRRAVLEAKPYPRKLGEKQLWIVKNESDWDHPFHLHGFFFQVVDEQGDAVGRSRGRTRSTSDEDDGAFAGDVRRASRASGCSTATSSTTPTAA